MVEIHITMDDKTVRKLLDDTERRHIPFATSLALNKTMNEVQEAVRTEAYPRVFTVRNKALAKAITTIPNGMRATKHRLKVTMTNARGAGEGFIGRQIAGARKTAKGRNIAIPVIGPGLRRLSGGSISKGKKPRANDKLIRIGNRLVERQKKKGLVTRFALTPTASASRRGRFRYYEVAQKTTIKRFQRNWTNAMVRALKTSR